MKSKAVKTVFGHSLVILCWIAALYFLYPYWDTVFAVIVATFGLVYVLAHFAWLFILVVVLPIWFLIALVKERNALRKKVEELEDRLG